MKLSLFIPLRRILQAPILADPLSNVRRYHKAGAIDDNHEVVSNCTMIQI